MTEEEFMHTRSALHEFFRRESRSSSIVINPLLRDDRTTKLIERLYEEEIPGRQFHVRVRDDGYPGVDAFWKRTGVDLEIMLVSVSTNSNEDRFPLIWDAYVNWMHKNQDADAVIDNLLTK